MIFVLLFSGTIALNYFTDPYLLYGSRRIEGFNKLKPVAGSHSRQSKIHLAHKMDMNLLIIGNSRPEMGIDPKHAYFRKHKLKPFNLGQPGSGLSSQYGYALDILREKDIKMVIIAVDFIDFITDEKNKSNPYDWPPKMNSADNRRKYNWNGTHNQNYFSQYFQDIYVPLIALGTLKDSILTLNSQGPESSNLRDDGFNPARDMNSATRKEGVRILFSQKIPQIVASFTSRDWKIYTPGHQWSVEFNNLQFLLNYLQNHGIETKIFINPYHIQYLEIIDYSGLSEEFSQWKRQLTKIVATTSKNKNITLWNFSDPGNYISEPIIKAGKTPLKWFWEPAHYRKELGDIMITNMMTTQPLSERTLESFGYILTPENIELSLTEYSIKLKKYRRDHSEEVNFLKEKFSSLTK